MTRAAVTRLVRIERVRKDVTEQAARGTVRALREGAQLDAERNAVQEALDDAADRVVASAWSGSPSAQKPLSGPSRPHPPTPADTKTSIGAQGDPLNGGPSGRARVASDVTACAEDHVDHHEEPTGGGRLPGQGGRWCQRARPVVPGCALATRRAGAR